MLPGGILRELSEAEMNQYREPYPTVENIEQEKIRETIIWNIRKIPYVRSTLTLMGIEEQD